MFSIEVNTQCRYATFSELNWLCSWAMAQGSGAHVSMIGAGPGVMALAVLEGNPGISMEVVDHTTCEYVQIHLNRLAAKIGIALPVSYYVMDSSERGRYLPKEIGGYYDLLIVDGDHSFEGVSRDLLAWLPHVKFGGHIFLHDYNADGTEFADQERYPGVALAVSNLMLPDSYEQVARVGTAIVFRKLS